MFLVPLSRRVVAQPRSFDRLFDDALGQLFNGHLATPSTWTDDRAPARRPAVDVTESDSSYVITLDVPGVRKEDVQVAVEGRRVSIIAEESSASEPATTAQAADGADSKDASAPAAVADAPKSTAIRTLVSERLSARYARSFTLPADIEQGGAQARLDNGVLTVTLPKRAANVARVTVN